MTCLIGLIIPELGVDTRVSTPQTAIVFDCLPEGGLGDWLISEFCA